MTTGREWERGRYTLTLLELCGKPRDEKCVSISEDCVIKVKLLFALVDLSVIRCFAPALSHTAANSLGFRGWWWWCLSVLNALMYWISLFYLTRLPVDLEAPSASSFTSSALILFFSPPPWLSLFSRPSHQIQQFDVLSRNSRERFKFRALSRHAAKPFADGPWCGATAETRVQTGFKFSFFRIIHHTYAK